MPRTLCSRFEKLLPASDTRTNPRSTGLRPTKDQHCSAANSVESSVAIVPLVSNSRAVIGAVTSQS